eukprot:gene3325-3648_t
MEASAKENGSRKGIVKCGTKWKAVYQARGVQYFLGIFETEDEANNALDAKIDQLRNLGITAGNADRNESSSSAEQTAAAVNGENESSDNDVNEQKSLESKMRRGRMLWERLTCLYQRWLLARAARTKLSEAQVANPDYHKDALLKSLNEEIVILGVAKSQLEQAVTNFFIAELENNDCLRSTSITSLGLHPTSEDHPLASMPTTDSTTDFFPLTSILASLGDGTSDKGLEHHFSEAASKSIDGEEEEAHA